MSERKSGRSREFDEPIALPDGRKLVTLRDAASYITALPKKEADTREWQTAIEALMLVVEFGGPTMFARIGVMRALNRHHVPEFNPSRKEYHWGRRKLKRDQGLFGSAPYVQVEQDFVHTMKQTTGTGGKPGSMRPLLVFLQTRRLTSRCVQSLVT